MMKVLGLPVFVVAVSAMVVSATASPKEISSQKPAWFGFWDPDPPAAMRGFTNIAFCSIIDAQAVAQAHHAAGIQCLFDLQSSFMTRSPNRSHALYDNYTAIWEQIGPSLCDIVTSGKGFACVYV